MHREYHRWFSPSLGRDMELLVFGHTGARVLVFPTSFARFHEWEDRRLIHAIGEHLERGWLQLYCVDTVDGESWYARHRHPAERAARHQQYDNYLTREVIPLTQHKNPNPFLITVGASFGAYHAINFGLRHPEHTGRILSMSGLCDIRSFADGYYSDAIYFNNPVDFIAGENEPWRFRHLDIILAVGRDDRLQDCNQRLSHALWSKGIGNALRIWDGFAHDWPVWERMLPMYVGGHD
jgi:esterase/lipase superfamily enzyme